LPNVTRVAGRIRRPNPRPDQIVARQPWLVGAKGEGCIPRGLPCSSGRPSTIAENPAFVWSAKWLCAAKCGFGPQPSVCADFDGEQDAGSQTGALESRPAEGGIAKNRTCTGPCRPRCWEHCRPFAKQAPRIQDAQITGQCRCECGDHSWNSFSCHPGLTPGLLLLPR